MGPGRKHNLRFLNCSNRINQAQEADRAIEHLQTNHKLSESNPLPSSLTPDPSAPYQSCSDPGSC